jgi:environmental stress-induced protein Ves
MTSPVLIDSEAVPPVAWRNGGGLTHELLAWPDAGAWQVRVSVAEIVRDGPFSEFPGVERWFTVLKGAGVELNFGGRAVRLTRTDAPLRFDGAAAPGCRLLDGPTRDLNLMLRGVPGGLQLVDDTADWTPASTAAGLFTAVAGTCTADGTEHAVPAYALLWFDRAPRSLRFTAGARPAAATGWWIAAGGA